MASIPVFVKHQGKKYEVEVDPSTTGEDFKLQLFSLTNVEPERQKILIKGGQLKDDADMGKLGLKPNQTIMMMGTPGSDGGDLVRPNDKIKFVEDMTEAERAKQDGSMPPGLMNLGNTCYLNASLQVMRSMPDLHSAFTRYRNTAGLDLVGQLGALFKKMNETQNSIPPMNLLNALRTAFPQFAEKSKSNNGYAQQDAEEAWSQIIHQLHQKLPVKPLLREGPEVSFVEKFMAGEFTSVLECDEEDARKGGEKAITSRDPFFKLSCHIDSQTNHLTDGILAALSEKLEKRSDVLGRDATYTKTSKISRAPKYLAVHFVRFFWKKETKKKAKIMRKVTFPQELDITEFCSDELRKALIPVRDKAREVRKDEEDLERASKRRKKSHDKVVEEQARKAQGKKEDQPQQSADGDTEMAETFKTDAQVEAEKDAALAAAKKELAELINPELRSDEGANLSGLYELRGVVTHQGASADSGHYTAYVKKPAAPDRRTGKLMEDGNWWWFNDDKVSEVTVDKVEALAGGGESHSALILLYKAISLDIPERKETMEGMEE